MGRTTIQADREEELRLAVEHAITEFRRTKAERDRLSDLSADVRDTRDGALAPRNAIRLHREAVQQLQKALGAFEALSKYPAKNG
jgi:hypothetical protein